MLFSSPLYRPNGTSVVPVLNATVEYLNDSNGLRPIGHMFVAFIKEVSSTGFQIGFRGDDTFSNIGATWPIRVHFSVQSM